MNENLSYYCFCRFKLGTEEAALFDELKTLFDTVPTVQTLAKVRKELLELDHSQFMIKNDTNNQLKFNISNLFGEEDEKNRINFYIMCRYQLTNNKLQVINETQRLYSTNAPTSFKINWLINLFMKPSGESSDSDSNDSHEIVESKNTVETQNKPNQSRVQELESEVNKLKQDYDSVKSEYENYRAEIELKLAMNEFKISNSEKELNEMKINYKAEISDHEKGKQELIDEIARLNCLLKQKEECSIEMKKDYDLIKTEFDAYKKKTESELNKKEREYNHLESNLKEITRKLETKKAEFLKLKHDSKNEIEKLNDLAKKQEENAIQLKKLHLNRIELMEQEIDNLKIQLENARSNQSSCDASCSIRSSDQEVDRAQLELIYSKAKDLYFQVNKSNLKDESLCDISNKELISQADIYISSLKYSVLDLICFKFKYQAEMDKLKKDYSNVCKKNEKLFQKKNLLIESMEDCINQFKAETQNAQDLLEENKTNRKRLKKNK